MSYEFIDTSALAMTAASPDPTGPLLQLAASDAGLDSDPEVIFPISAKSGGADSATAEGPRLDELFDLADPLEGAEAGDGEEEVIVVIGTKKPRETGGEGGGSTGTGSGVKDYNNIYFRGDYQYSVPDSSMDGNVDVIAPPADQAVIEITINVDPVTPEQAAVVEKYRVAVQEAAKAVRALADNEMVTLKDGSTVTGKELKQIWATLDITINPVGFNEYQNKSMRGEASYVNGDAKVGLNMDIVEKYSKLIGGLEYLALHEISHMTKAAQDYYAKLWLDGLTEEEAKDRERYTDDLARAIAADYGLTFLTSPTYGYNTAHPLIFSSPPADPETGGGGEDGGGGIVGRTPG